MVVAIVTMVLAAACQRGDDGGARLQVRWTGADTGTFTAPATADWCDSLGLLEIRAVSGDTGVELALYHGGAVAAGSYPVRLPDSARRAPPSAAIGLRWFSRTAVQGYQSTGGQVTLRRAPDGILSGSFTAAVNPFVVGRGKLTVSGSFDDLRERPAARGCYAQPPDTSAGVH